MAKLYPVLTRLKHDGKSYEPGSSVRLSDTDGERLQALGVVGAHEPDTTGRKPEKETDQGTEPEAPETPAVQAQGQTDGAADGDGAQAGRKAKPKGK